MWTDYLSKVSDDWAKNVGKGTAVKWPVGLGGKGNEGVAAIIKNTPNAIGYVELIYALKSDMPFGEVRNKAGKFIKADLASASVAAAGVEMPDDFRVSITNSAAPAAYPISSFTWLLIPEKISDPAKKTAITGLLKWVLTTGQGMTSKLSYAPLPKVVVDQGTEGHIACSISRGSRPHLCGARRPSRSLPRSLLRSPSPRCSPDASCRRHRSSALSGSSRCWRRPASICSPPTRPSGLAETQRLTPLKVRYYIDNGKPRYWFNDPVNCHCVYVGSEKNYQQYEQIRLSQQAARQEAEAAQMNEEAAAAGADEHDAVAGPVHHVLTSRTNLGGRRARAQRPSSDCPAARSSPALATANA